MPVVWIPALMRDLTGGAEQVAVPGDSIRAVIEALEVRFPGIRDRLCEGPNLRPGLAVVVGTEVSRRGLNQPVNATDEVHFLPALGGG